jgi:hypothetical protein
MLIYVIPPKFTKGHLNATFQSNELELAAINKSTSINPFNYAPQTNQASVLAVKKEFDLKQNEKNFSISKMHHKQVSSHIEGIGKINMMEDVAMTCANICGVQLAIVDISLGKPLLYQFVWKLIKFIKNKNFNLGMHAMRHPLSICPCSSWENFISVSGIWLCFLKTVSTLTKLSTAS